MRSRSSPAGRCCVGAALLGLVLAAHGGTVLYKWVDAAGVTHYADRPEPGAQRVEVGRAQGYPATTARGGTPPQPPAAVATIKYTRLAIVSPEDGSSVWNDGGHVAVLAALEPELAGGHHLWFSIDGESQAGPAAGLSTSLELPRGSHTVSATVTDANGVELITSAAVSFSVHQTSSPLVPRGPMLSKPKSK